MHRCLHPGFPVLALHKFHKRLVLPSQNLISHFPTLGAICHGLLKNSHVPAEDRTGDPSIYSLALYHVAIKAGLYRKAVQVYYIPNQYPVTLMNFMRAKFQMAT